MKEIDKPLVWLHSEIKTPPFSSNARLTAGYFLRKLQQGESLMMPDIRPMPTICSRCHELRVPGRDKTWRIICRIDSDAVIIANVFAKKTPKTPKKEIELSQDRLKRYDQILE